MKVMIILLLFLSLAQAQHHEQPQKESSMDLRSHFVLFSLENPDEKLTYALERTAAQDYFLRRRVKKEEQIIKISSKEALQLDRDFASRFLKCQYEIEAQAGECEVTLRLSMKGERQDICDKDDKKSQEIKPLMTELAKRF